MACMGCAADAVGMTVVIGAAPSRSVRGATRLLMRPPRAVRAHQAPPGRITRRQGPPPAPCPARGAPL